MTPFELELRDVVLDDTGITPASINLI